MEFDAFSAGVEPGGLRNTREIGILICYMLDQFEKPIAREDLIDSIQENGIANYFEVSSAVSELVKLGNLKYEDEKTIAITKNGKLVAKQLGSELSSFIRQKALKAVKDQAELRINEKENPVRIEKADDGGYYVTVCITDGTRDLMSLTLLVPERNDAETVKKNFYKNPEKVYSMIIAATIQDKDMINELIKEHQND